MGRRENSGYNPRMKSSRLLLITAVILLVTACGSKKEKTDAGQSPGVVTAYSANGWSEAERAEYYHLPEGSELMPYMLLANVTSIKTGKPFIQDMERFGFLPDAASPNNPHGLPVGLTVTRSRNASLQGIEMLGFNCAACHANEITYRGKRLRIDGAPALINLQGYQIEFADSLDATLKSPQKLLALVMAIERQQNVTGTTGAYATGASTTDDTLRKAAEVKEASTADRAFHSVSSEAADAKSQPAPAGPSIAAVITKDISLLQARLAYVKHVKLILDGTEPGPGRVDAFGAARNLLFSQYARKMLSPVSFPFLWSVPDNTKPRAPGEEMRWIHYDGNTNSILERNIGQALGMGAVFDPDSFESSIRIKNLHRLEVLTHKLQPPKWPAEMLGPVDETKARAGEQIFNTKCAGCHQDKLFAPLEVGTDPNRANSFGQPIGDKPFPEAVAPILRGLKLRAFQDDGVSKAEQATMDPDPVIWRATGQYKARLLRGIWATAPYLHNGSVPTLYHLLHPDQRPAQFVAGNREYDPVKLGYVSDAGGGSANARTYDTTQPGNSNIGHNGDRFGTSLPEEQKAALLEYLKML